MCCVGGFEILFSHDCVPYESDCCCGVAPLSRTRRVKDKARGKVAQRLVKVLRLETSVISKPILFRRFFFAALCRPPCPVSDEGSKPSGGRSKDQNMQVSKMDSGLLKRFGV